MCSPLAIEIAIGRLEAQLGHLQSLLNNPLLSPEAQSTLASDLVQHSMEIPPGPASLTKLQSRFATAILSQGVWPTLEEECSSFSHIRPSLLRMAIDMKGIACELDGGTQVLWVALNLLSLLPGFGTNSCAELIRYAQICKTNSLVYLRTLLDMIQLEGTARSRFISQYAESLVFGDLQLEEPEAELVLAVVQAVGGANTLGCIDVPCRRVLLRCLVECEGSQQIMWQHLGDGEGALLYLQFVEDTTTVSLPEDEQGVLSGAHFSDTLNKHQEGICGPTLQELLLVTAAARCKLHSFAHNAMTHWESASLKERLPRHSGGVYPLPQWPILDLAIQEQAVEYVLKWIHHVGGMGMLVQAAHEPWANVNTTNREELDRLMTGGVCTLKSATYGYSEMDELRTKLQQAIQNSGSWDHADAAAAEGEPVAGENPLLLFAIFEAFVERYLTTAAHTDEKGYAYLRKAVADLPGRLPHPTLKTFIPMGLSVFSSGNSEAAKTKAAAAAEVAFHLAMCVCGSRSSWLFQILDRPQAFLNGDFIPGLNSIDEVQAVREALNAIEGYLTWYKCPNGD